MVCSPTKRLANKTWPLFPSTKSGECCYVITVDSADEAAIVVADAQTKSDYVRRTQFFDLPDDKIQVYLYFKKP
jgi:hypothetical protein